MIRNALLGLLVLAQSTAVVDHGRFLNQLYRGEKAYHQGDYAKAERAFRSAAETEPNQGAAHLDLGETLFRAGKFGEAASEFQKVQQDPDPAMRAKASYNLGNAMFKQKQLNQALDAYKQALRWNQGDDDARYNLQVVQQLLKQQPPQQGPQKDNKDKNKKDQKDKNKQQHQKNDQQKQKSSKNDQNKSKQQANNKQKQDQQKQKQDQNQQNQQKQQQKQQQQQSKQQQQKQQQQKQTPTPASPSPTPPGGEPGKMSKQDAERLLNYFKNKEKAGRVQPHHAAPSGDEPW